MCGLRTLKKHTILSCCKCFQSAPTVNCCSRVGSQERSQKLTNIRLLSSHSSGKTTETKIGFFVAKLQRLLITLAKTNLNGNSHRLLGNLCFLAYEVFEVLIQKNNKFMLDCSTNTFVSGFFQQFAGPKR